MTFKANYGYFVNINVIIKKYVYFNGVKSWKNKKKLNKIWPTPA